MASTDSAKRIFIWLHPRSVSTALEKCMANVPGVEVWHEPYCTCYFNHVFENKLDLLPRMKLLASGFEAADAELKAAKGKHLLDGGNLMMSSEYSLDWVKKNLEKPLDKGKNFLLCKDAAFGIHGHYDKLPSKGNFKHTFLIRNPRRTALSANKVLQTIFRDKSDDFDMYSGHAFVQWEELSKDCLYDLYNHVRKTDPNPIVIDADDLVSYPEKILPKYFEQIGLKYDDKYLKWDASIDIMKTFYGCKDQLVWGMKEGVYDTAYHSSKYMAPSKPPPAWRDLSPSMVKFASDFEDGYRAMYENRIKPF